MTHTTSSVERALYLHRSGLAATQISIRLGIPRRTISDWVRGRSPRPRGSGSGRDCRTCGARHSFGRLPLRYSYLLGLYLGDGSIARHPRSVFKLRLTLDARYPGLIAKAAEAMAEVLPASKVNTRRRPSGDVEVYSYSRSWPCLFPQHGPGAKHHRRIVLTGWQKDAVRRAPQLLLRGLIHSDGCRFTNTGRRWSHPRYSFSNRSPDIRDIFIDACRLMGVHHTTSGHTIYVSRKDDVARLDGFIGPKG